MNSPASWRTLFVLGRVSNLPTVWSNCLAAWLLGGGGTHWDRFVLILAGATFLYIGGMYLNDAFDANFDAQHRRERPVPSGRISIGSVWKIGIVLLVLGLLLVAPLGITPSLNAVVLALCILLYDAVHKLVTFSPVLMAMCRFFLYVTASSAPTGAATGAAVWAGVAMATYITGLSYIARKESTGVRVQAWPIVLLVLPIGLALLVNDGITSRNAIMIAIIYVLWSARSLRTAFMAPLNIPRAVSGLLAGIVWVDWLAVADQPRERGAAFIALFLLALLFQRFVPAT
jgi:4-hydroxybenzoate polyprenyltransferase